jgi:hypothetical protein
LHASYAKEDYYQKITGLPLVFTTCLCNFQTKLEEISLSFQEKRVFIRSYPDDQSMSERSLLHTEVILDPDEFDIYQVTDKETHLTFSLREFKAFLTFAEALGQAVHIHFSCSGA